MIYGRIAQLLDCNFTIKYESLAWCIIVSVGLFYNQLNNSLSSCDKMYEYLIWYWQIFSLRQVMHITSLLLCETNPNVISVTHLVYLLGLHTFDSGVECPASLKWHKMSLFRLLLVSHCTRVSRERFWDK